MNLVNPLEWVHFVKTVLQFYLWFIIFTTVRICIRDDWEKKRDPEIDKNKAKKSQTWDF